MDEVKSLFWRLVAVTFMPFLSLAPWPTSPSARLTKRRPNRHSHPRPQVFLDPGEHGPRLDVLGLRILDRVNQAHPSLRIGTTAHRKRPKRSRTVTTVQ